MNIPLSEEQVFEAARELKNPAERNAYLDATCAGDADLRRSVEELLAADGGAESFFAEGGSALNQSALDLATAEQPGDRINAHLIQLRHRERLPRFPMSGFARQKRVNH